MDPTHQSHPKSTTTTNPHRCYLPHPLPDPTIIPHPSTTIQNISHRFTKLYSNHKKSPRGGNSFKPLNVCVYSHPPPHPEPETDFQTKTISSFSTVFDTPCTTLTKSNSHHERKISSNNSLSLVNVVKLKDKDEIKKPSSIKDSKKQSLHECDVKKTSHLMPKSLESDKLKRNQDGSEVKRPSISSIPPMVNGGGRRKSFCNSQAELADFFSCTGVKVVAVDMPPFMQIHAVDCARKTRDSLEKFTSKTLALTLKKEFDGVYGPAWHCIVGTSFGSFVTHSVGGFMYFSLDHKLYILFFKTAVQKAE